ncbi:hypothetical protein GFC01_14190 [Desulfofundulus thermobenzoicus]|uniref:Uncharacterized protein n=1 Tax=Desulfofundulus thermobenzoicus TaxID=29376 RepID=A0A6N7IVB3_9FIRM|nr:hypothetical protein [Desulfofundulus thermobenzoicus]MQL53387.1 hypothetical protein [Desulfofundulus thermobenzoicus]
MRWLVITIVVIGLSMVMIISGGSYYNVYQEVIDYQQQATAYQEAYQKAVDDWLKSDEAAELREKRAKAVAMALVIADRSHTVTYNDIKIAKQDIDKYIQEKAKEKAVEIIGNAPPSPEISIGEAQKMLQKAYFWVGTGIVIVCLYIVFSIIYWLRIWMLKKHSTENNGVTG